MPGVVRWLIFSKLGRRIVRLVAHCPLTRMVIKRVVVRKGVSTLLSAAEESLGPVGKDLLKSRNGKKLQRRLRQSKTLKNTVGRATDTILRKL